MFLWTCEARQRLNHIFAELNTEWNDRRNCWRTWSDPTTSNRKRLTFASDTERWNQEADMKITWSCRCLFNENVLWTRQEARTKILLIAFISNFHISWTSKDFNHHTSLISMSSINWRSVKRRTSILFLFSKRNTQSVRSWINFSSILTGVFSVYNRKSERSSSDKMSWNIKMTLKYSHHIVFIWWFLFHRLSHEQIYLKKNSSRIR